MTLSSSPQARLKALGASLALLSSVGLASATPQAVTPQREVEVAATLSGLVGGSFLTEPSDKTFEQEGVTYQGAYPGFGGVGGGAGLSAQVMWRGFVGLDWGLMYQVDQGSGEINNVELTLKQTALHMPLFLRLEAPLEDVRPFVFFGPEWIFPGDPEVSAESGAFDLKGSAETYMAWGFGFGFAFVLPVKGADVRVPLRFSGAFNPNSGDDIEDRMEGLEPVMRELHFITEWTWHARAELGVAWYFL